MFSRASLVAAAALALAACGGAGSDNSVGSQSASVDDGTGDTGTGDTGDTGEGTGDSLTCDDARAAFAACRTQTEPTCAPIAQQLHDCIDDAANAGTTDPAPTSDVEPGDDTGDEGDVSTPEEGGCPGHHHGGEGREGGGRMGGEGRDGGHHRAMPEACQPVADQLRTCMSACADAHDAMHDACRPAAPDASACNDAIAAANACIQSHDDCDQGPESTCFTDCSPVVQQARETCRGEMGGHRGGHHGGDRDGDRPAPGGDEMGGHEGGHHHGDRDQAGGDDDGSSDDGAGEDGGQEG